MRGSRGKAAALVASGLALLFGMLVMPVNAQNQQADVVTESVQAPEFFIRTLSPSDIAFQSDLGVTFREGTELTVPSLASERFVEFESTQGKLRLQSGDYIGFERVSGPTSEGLYANEIARLLRSSRLDAVGGHAIEPWAAQPAQQLPSFPGFRYVTSNRIWFRAQSQKYIGLWQANTGDETLIVAFDEPPGPVAGRPLAEIVARLPFKVAGISATGSHHGGPSAIIMVTDPDSQGRFLLFSLKWPNPLSPNDYWG